MNDKKICFIWCTEDEIYYKESAAYVDSLEIPEGYYVEKKTATNINVAKAYNEASKATDAKFKVFISDKLFILNKNFLYEILEAFQSKNIGMIGVLGAKTIPTSGVWQESQHMCGKLYIGTNEETQIYDYSAEMVDRYNECKVIDGSLMVTQYDIRWREDLFEGKYYFDDAQCAEYIKQGYKIIVPRQEEPWCLFDMDNVDNIQEYDNYKQIYLNEYSKDIYPLVSILIPAYNQPEFFKIALESALNQTYKNIEVIVGDDSTNDEVKVLIEPYLKKYCNLSYYNNGGPLGEFGYHNLKNILQKSNGEYINALMHDDIFHTDKIKIMMNYYIERDDITLVTSYRQLIDEKGNYLPSIVSTKKLFNETTVVSGEELARYILFNFLNIIGEPTTVLLKRKDIGEMYGTYMSKDIYRCLIDKSQWLECLRKGNAVYISDALSYFRQHKNQNQKDTYLMMLGAIDSFNYIYDSFQNNFFIKDYSEYITILNTWLNAYSPYLHKIEEMKKRSNYKENDISNYMKCINNVITELNEYINESKNT